jgi:hypothetical protein
VEVPNVQPVSLRIGAPAPVIFEILSDPSRHREFDGSGVLRAGGSNMVITKIGDVITTRMHLPAIGDYEMRNIVIAFEVNKRIQWEPAPGDRVGADASGLVIGTSPGYGWGFELTPESATETTVTESFDCSAVSKEMREAVVDGEEWRESMSRSLERLGRLCAQVPPNRQMG